MNANEDVPVEENTESFLSYEDDSAGGGTSTPFKASKRRGGNKKQAKGDALFQTLCPGPFILFCFSFSSQIYIYICFYLVMLYS